MTFEDGNPIKFQGQVNMMNFLRENEAAYSFVENRVNAIVSGHKEDYLQIDAETDAKALAEAAALLVLS